MSRISRDKLRDMIKLEIKALVDEDVLLKPPSLGEPHYMDYHDDDYDEYDDDDYDEDEYEYRPQKRMVSLYEGDCGCGPSSYENPYDLEREEDYEHYGHEVDIHHKGSSYMARPQLRKIATYASKLFDMVEEGEQLEDWQESKIAQMSQMIGDVYHSIEYHEEGEDLDVNDIIGMIRTGNI
tara:strand:- start:65 stop:607 length:543 start_codon:yes stop_codon:yes gene_type:complete